MKCPFLQEGRDLWSFVRDAGVVSGLADIPSASSCIPEVPASEGQQTALALQ